MEMEGKKIKGIIKVLGKEFEITAKHTGEIEGFPNSDDNMMHNVFNITVKREFENGAITKSFKFYDSNANWEKGKTTMGLMDMLLAFKSFLEDAWAGSMDFEEFCGEYGYNSDSRRAEKIYNECKEQLEKVMDLGIYESELADFINTLNEIECEGIMICSECGQEKCTCGKEAYVIMDMEGNVIMEMEG